MSKPDSKMPTKFPDNFYLADMTRKAVEDLGMSKPEPDPWFRVDQMAKLIEAIEPDQESIDFMWEKQFSSYWKWLCWFRHDWIHLIPTKLGRFMGTNQKSRFCARCGDFDYWGEGL